MCVTEAFELGPKILKRRVHVRSPVQSARIPVTSIKRFIFADSLTM